MATLQEKRINFNPKLTVSNTGGNLSTDTYRNTETTEISGQKVWDDYNNKFNTRPENITINLLQNGEEIDEVTLENTAKQDWNYSFKELPVYDAEGETYVYTVSEDKVPGYSTEIVGYMITNHLVPIKSETLEEQKRQHKQKCLQRINQNLLVTKHYQKLMMSHKKDGPS